MFFSRLLAKSPPRSEVGETSARYARYSVLSVAVPSSLAGSQTQSAGGSCDIRRNQIAKRCATRQDLSLESHTSIACPELSPVPGRSEPAISCTKGISPQLCDHCGPRFPKPVLSSEPNDQAQRPTRPSRPLIGASRRGGVDPLQRSVRLGRSSDRSRRQPLPPAPYFNFTLMILPDWDPMAV